MWSRTSSIRKEQHAGINKGASIGLPVTLEQLGIKDDRLEEMADRCTNEGTLTRGSLVKLGKSDIIEIYKLSRE